MCVCVCVCERERERERERVHEHACVHFTSCFAANHQVIAEIY